MKRSPIFIALVVLISATSCIHTLVAQQSDLQLQQKLEQALHSFHGTAGVYVRHIPSGVTTSINADTLFPTASMIKVPILFGVFDKLERGELKYDQSLLYLDTLKYDDGITGSWKDSTTVPLATLVTLMICFSDNTASLWLQALAGTGTQINELMESNGFLHTRVNSRTPGREGMYEEFGWGVTTPREMAEIVARIAEGVAVSSAASEEMQRVLGTIHVTKRALSQIPPTVKTLSKQGAIDRSKSEVAYVYAPSGAYVFCIITKNQEDTRWASDNEGYILLRTISRILWHHYEPGNPWTPLCDPVKWNK